MAYQIALWTFAAIGALATARGIASAIEWARDKWRSIGG